MKKSLKTAAADLQAVIHFQDFLKGIHIMEGGKRWTIADLDQNI